MSCHAGSTAHATAFGRVHGNAAVASGSQCEENEVMGGAGEMEGFMLTAWAEHVASEQCLG